MLVTEKKSETRSPYENLISCSRILEDTFRDEMREYGWKLIVEPTVNEVRTVLAGHLKSAVIQIPKYLYMLVVTIIHPATTVPERLQQVIGPMRSYIDVEGGFSLDIDPYSNRPHTVRQGMTANVRSAMHNFTMLSLFGQTAELPRGLKATA